MEGLGDRSIRDSLPLPVARLWRRARNAKSAKDRHDTAYFAWEVSIRLCVAASPPADPTPLARASIGTWANALGKGDRPIQEASLLDAHRAWAEVVTGTAPARRSIAAKELFATLAAYRNKVIGHGSVRDADFYDANGKGLLEALEVAWRSGLFLADGARLVFVESVELTSTGERKARVLEVSGDASMVIDPNGIFVPEQILPRRLYLRTASAWTPLHPWLLFDETEEHLWCFNGLGRRAEYLDYASGETLAGDALGTAFPSVEDEVRALLGPGDRSADSRTAEIAEDRRFGDYEVLGKLGQGGIGAVYLARQQSLGRLVALKMLPAERAKDPVAVARFRREIRALAKCDHPNVVKILASGETRGIHYYAMEYVDGVDLGRVARTMSTTTDFDSAVSSACEVARGERSELFPDLPQIPRRTTTPLRGDNRYRQIARFFVQAAEGLHHLHERGIIHRDISPANIMVTWPEERAVIMDLGLAALEDASVSLTKDKSRLLGTLRYLAPEQLQKNLLEIDRRADVYSLGATMYELLAGRPVFDGETEAQLIQQILREEPQQLDRLLKDAPRDLGVVIRHMIEKDPLGRYVDADAVASDLSAWLSGEMIRARAPSAYKLARSALVRHRWAVAALAGTVLGLYVGGILGRYYSEHHADPAIGHLVRELGVREASLAAIGTQDPDSLREWIDDMRRLRDSPVSRSTLADCRALLSAQPEGEQGKDLRLTRNRHADSLADCYDALSATQTSLLSSASKVWNSTQDEANALISGKFVDVLSGDAALGPVPTTYTSENMIWRTKAHRQIANIQALQVLGRSNDSRAFAIPETAASNTPRKAAPSDDQSSRWEPGELDIMKRLIDSFTVSTERDPLTRLHDWISVLHTCAQNWQTSTGRRALAAEVERLLGLLDRINGSMRVWTTRQPRTIDDLARRERALDCLLYATIAMDEEGGLLREAAWRLAIATSAAEPPK